MKNSDTKKGKFLKYQNLIIIIENFEKILENQFSTYPSTIYTFGRLNLEYYYKFNKNFSHLINNSN